MSGLDSNAPPEISVATTSRSKCQSCKEVIKAGSIRVGMVGRHSGISVRKWLKPQCFVDNMLVDYAPTNRATCKISGTGIAKGEVRLLFRLIGCDGKVQSQHIMKPSVAHELFQSFVDIQGISLSAETVPGLDSIDAAHREYVVDALSGRDVQSRPVPINEPPAKAKKEKKEPKAETEAKSGAKRRAAEQVSDVKPTNKAAKKAVKAAPADDGDEDDDADIVD